VFYPGTWVAQSVQAVVTVDPRIVFQFVPRNPECCLPPAGLPSQHFVSFSYFIVTRYLFYWKCYFFYIYCYVYYKPIKMASRSKAWPVFAVCSTGILCSNPTQAWMSMHLLCVCVVLCVGCGIATGWSPVQGVLPTVYKIKKLEKRPRSNKGL
jgi:hypothetical protein